MMWNNKLVRFDQLPEWKWAQVYNFMGKEPPPETSVKGGQKRLDERLAKAKVEKEAGVTASSRPGNWEATLEERVGALCDV